MDFVPVLIAILFQPFAGFTMLGGDGEEKIDLYYYGAQPAGSLIQLQCKSGSGDYIDFQNAYVEGQNVNTSFPGLPIRRAFFSSIMQNLPQACQVTTRNTPPPSYLGVCKRIYTTYITHKMNFRLVSGGQVLNMWDADEELRFIADAAEGNNMRLAAIKSDMKSPDFREFVATGKETTTMNLTGGQPGANGMPCHLSVDSIKSTVGTISFSHYGFVENVDFFDFGNYRVKVDQDYLFDKLGIDTDYRFPTKDIILIQYDDPAKWGADEKFWDLFKKILIEVWEDLQGQP